jgi:peptide/nickel transport system substrate-binding protein
MTRCATRRSFLSTAARSALGAASLASPLLASRALGATAELRWLTAENVTGNWDPNSNTTLANILVEEQVYESLVSYPMAGTDPTAPRYDLATAYKVLSPHEIEFRLRPDIRFHDGRPLTAEDVKASIEYASIAKARPLYPGRVECKVIDKTTVRMDTSPSGQSAFGPLFLQGHTRMMSAAAIADGKALQLGMNGTGAYRLAGVEKGEIVMEANPNYWGGAPAIKRVTMRHVGDGNARVLALLSGEAQLVERLEPEQYASLQQRPAVKVVATRSIENRYLHFRCAKPPFNDARMRRAAALAVDRSAVMQIIGVAGYAADSVVPPSKFGYIALPGYGRFDPKESARLMAEAGFPGGKGLPELEYLVSTGFYPKSKEYGELITAQLQAAGFPVRMTVLEVAAWNERYYNVQSGHLIDGGWAPSTPEPNLQFMLQYHSKNALVTGLHDPVLDAALERESSAPDLESRRRMLQTETLPLVARTMPNLVLFNSMLLHAATAGLSGHSVQPNGHIDLRRARLA